MTDRDYERMERRKRLREKSRITSIIAGVVIAVAAIAIVIVVVALVSKNRPQEQPAATVAVTEQPTLYRPEEHTEATESRTESSATQPSWTQQETQAPYIPATQSWEVTPTTAAATAAESGSSSSAEGALHYTASGQTSYGYNWTYSGGGGVVSINCGYDFNTHQYDFVITGVAPGTTSFTLIYYTGDDQTVSVPMSVSVDADLKVTQI